MTTPSSCCLTMPTGDSGNAERLRPPLGMKGMAVLEEGVCDKEGVLCVLCMPQCVRGE